MKIPQRVALVIAAVLLSAAFLFVPWNYPMDKAHRMDAGYAPVFAPPPSIGGDYPKYPVIDFARWTAQLLAVLPLGFGLYMLMGIPSEEARTEEPSGVSEYPEGETEADSMS